jgi:hypothetical protein
MLRGRFGQWLLSGGTEDQAKLDAYIAAWKAWGEHPDSFHANVHVEVIGHKPGQFGQTTPTNAAQNR